VCVCVCVCVCACVCVCVRACVCVVYVLLLITPWCLHVSVSDIRSSVHAYLTLIDRRERKAFLSVCKSQYHHQHSPHTKSTAVIEFLLLEDMVTNNRNGPVWMQF
jgi:hypothetical protein